MAPDLEFRGQPFLPDDTAGASLARSLADESMRKFQMAVAWGRFGGVARMESHVAAFRERGGTAGAVVGIDEGVATKPGLRKLLDLFDSVHVVHDPGGRTFHPKLYLVEGLTARLFALAYANAADAAIVTWRDKARYVLWRPITAIHEAANDGNAATEADTAWTSLITAPPYPEHPSGLTSIGCSVIDTLQDFYGYDVATYSATTLPTPAAPLGVTRTFNSFSQLCDDIVDARVWSGIHFRFADDESAKLARRVAHWGTRHAFR